MSQEKNSQVLFIAGPGRSGSTLLDLLLGQINGFCSTGELRYIWKRGFQQNQLCGCGKPFRECEFWADVIQEGFGGFERVDYERLENLRRSAERRVSKEFPLQNVASHLGPHEEYLKACRDVYRAIHKISGCRYIVDSSKNIWNGFLLSTIPEIDLSTVHLIRDSRAVAYSWQRLKVRPEAPGQQKFMSRRGILKSARRWNSRNRLAHQLQETCRRHASLRYEDLARDPMESLARLLSDLQIAHERLDFLDNCHAVLKRSHTVSGNPVRFECEEIEIKPDMQWQRAMAKPKKWLVTFLTLPLLLRYGYLNSGR